LNSNSAKKSRDVKKAAAKFILCLAVLVLLAGLAAFSGCRDIVTGSGEITTLELAHANFTRVEIATGFDMTITRADAFYLSITLDKSLYEYLTIAQRGDTLLIGLKPDYTYTASSRSGIIRMPDLRRLVLSGGSRATVTGFTEDHAVDFELSGASVLQLDPLQSTDSNLTISGGSTFTGVMTMKNGNFNVSGGSKLTLKGSAASIKVTASGASEVTMEEFPAPTANMVVSGGSSAVINVSDLLDVNLSGASTLDYIGSPKLGGIKISGGSKMNQRE
jgi:hypothetical protein